MPKIMSGTEATGDHLWRCRAQRQCLTLPAVPATSEPAPDLFEFEKSRLALGVARVAGIDEAGRGPLAGPVVAAAVIFPSRWVLSGLPPELEGLNDSKQLSESRRESYFDFLIGHPQIEKGVASIEPEVIDRINILQATHRAMALTLRQLGHEPGHVLIDGRPVPGLTPPQTALIKGDSRSYSIAAASVIAKVTRDRRMLELDRLYPGYGFADHKGYGTPEHLDALDRLGTSPIHRLSFAPCRPRQPEFL